MKKLVRSMIHRAIISSDYTDLERIKGYIAYICSIEENFKEKITKYIKKFYEDPITLNSDAVKAFNLNKLFSTLEDLCERKSSHFCKDDSVDDFLWVVNYERQEYLKKHGFASKNE